MAFARVNHFGKYKLWKKSENKTEHFHATPICVLRKGAFAGRERPNENVLLSSSWCELSEIDGLFVHISIWLSFYSRWCVHAKSQCDARYLAAIVAKWRLRIVFPLTRRAHTMLVEIEWRLVDAIHIFVRLIRAPRENDTSSKDLSHFAIRPGQFDVQSKNSWNLLRCEVVSSSAPLCSFLKPIPTVSTKEKKAKVSFFHIIE